MREVTEKEIEAMRKLCIETQSIDTTCDGPNKRFQKCDNICMECEKEWLRHMGWKENELPTKFIPLFLRR